MKTTEESSVNRYTKNCRWVLASGEYCEKPVSYEYFKNDDGSRTRGYRTFCYEHQKRADAQDQEDTA